MNDEAVKDFYYKHASQWVGHLKWEELHELTRDLWRSEYGLAELRKSKDEG